MNTDYSSRHHEHHVILQYFKTSSNFGYSHCDIPVYRSDLVPSPMVIGFKKAIFLPETEFDHKELVNILEHELTHLRNKDIYIKNLINLLTIIYWWFPPIYVLQRQIDLFLEIRVDNKVTGNYSEKESLQYAQTLVSVQKKDMRLSARTR